MGIQEKFPETLEKVQATKTMALEYKDCAVEKVASSKALVLEYKECALEKVLTTKQTLVSKWERVAAKVKAKYENFSLEQFKADVTALALEYKELAKAKALAKKEEVTSYMADFKLEEKATEAKEVALAKAAMFKD